MVTGAGGPIPRDGQAGRADFDFPSAATFMLEGPPIYWKDICLIGWPDTRRPT
jgi:hypothetical protein